MSGKKLIIVGLVWLLVINVFGALDSVWRDWYYGEFGLGGTDLFFVEVLSNFIWGIPRSEHAWFLINLGIALWWSQKGKAE